MKKGKASWIFAWALLVVGLLLSTLGVLNGMVILPEDLSKLSVWLSAPLSITGGEWGCLEAGIFLLLESLILFICRMRKPFSMMLSVYLLPVYGTLVAAVRLVSGVPMPFYVPAQVKTTQPLLVFLLFALESILGALLLMAVAGLDRRWKKKHDLNQKLLEKEGLLKSKEQEEEEKLLKKQKKLNDHESRKAARENAKYQKQLDKAAAAEKAKADKAAEKERKAYEKAREKEALKKEAEDKKLRDKALKEQDKLLEKAELENAKKHKLFLKEEKKRQAAEEAALVAAEEERKRKEEEEIGPAPEYARGLANPDTPLEFPDFDPMPDLRNIVPPTVEDNYDPQPDILKLDNSSFMDNLKAEVEKEYEEEEQEEFSYAPLQFKEPVEKPVSKMETKRFNQGGMLEAALELYNAEQKEVKTWNSNPIIGVDEPEEPEEKESASSIAPSTLSPDHPRYRMFESLQSGPVAPKAENPSLESHKNEEVQAPSYLSPDHPRYKLFASLNGAPAPVEKEEKKEDFAPSTLPQDHPRYKMFESLHNNEVVQPQREAKPKTDASIAPSDLPTDHPRYKLFEALRKKEPVKTTPEEEMGVTHFPSRAFQPEDERVISHSYGSVSQIPQPVVMPQEPETVNEEEVDDEKEDLLMRLKSAPLQPPVEPVQKKPVFEEVEIPEEEEIPVDDDDDDVEIEEIPAEPVKPQVAPAPKPTPAPVFQAPTNPEIRSIKEADDGHKVFQVKSDEEQEEDFNMVVGVGDLATNRAGYTAIRLRQEAMYASPDMALLKDYPGISQDIDPDTYAQGQIIISTLAEQKLNVELSQIIKGPTVTLFELKLASASIITKFKGREDELSYALGGRKIRILAPIPGKQAVGVEVPNTKTAIVGFKDMVYALRANEKYMKMKVPMILGKTITGEPIVIDVCKMPHMIIAGTTGSGKSVCINSLINSIIYQKGPKDVRLMMVDPKVVELTIYNGIPHLLTPVITDPKRAIKALDWLVAEMERRYAMLAKYTVRNIDGLNEKIASGTLPGVEKLPYIVMVMDEFADIMVQVGKEMDAAIGRIAAKARAAGIHLILATQRPSADVITGTLKSNLPARIAFAVSSGLNSRVILDEMGAENLLGKGDMLLLNPSEMGTKRIQGAFVSDSEVEAVVKFAYENNPGAEYLEETIFEEEEPLDDDGGDDDFGDDGGDGNLYEMAKKIVFERKSASASYLQRRLKIGYNRAARLVEMMEEEGIVGPANGSKPREVLRFD